MKYLPILMLCLLSACASTPSEHARFEASSQEFQQMSRPNNVTGWQEQWSGIIAETHNLANGTDIEVVYLPLNRWGVPIQTEQSPGRFIAHFNQTLDPVLYAKGRSLTVTGTTAPSRLGNIGESPYRFAVLNATEHKLWPPMKEVEVRYEDPMWGPGPLMAPYRMYVPR